MVRSLADRSFQLRRTAPGDGAVVPQAASRAGSRRAVGGFGAPDGSPGSPGHRPHLRQGRGGLRRQVAESGRQADALKVLS